MKQVWRGSRNGVQSLIVRIQVRHGGKKSPGIWMARIVKDLVGSSSFHDFSCVHNVDEICNLGNNSKVMCNIDYGNSTFLLNLLDQLNDLRLDGNVKSGSRLVADQKIRVAGQGNGN